MTQLWRPLQKSKVHPMMDKAATKLKEIYAKVAN
jgi:hypothetical protein